MALYSRILVPVDGSEPSQAGLREAVRVAKDSGATLVLLNVVNELSLPVGDPGFAYYGELSEYLTKAGQDLVAQTAHEVEAAGVARETLVVDGGAGAVSDAIVEQATLRNCGLIVMGTHGRRGMKRFALGSDAELVVRHARVPVLLVRAPEAAAAA